MVKLSDVELPIIFENQLLFASGKWNPKTNNDFHFTKEMVNSSVKNTKWSPLNKRLYLKHSGAYDVSKWAGSVENIYSQEGKVYGDVHIWDEKEGVQIRFGNKPVAISADIEYNDNLMFFKGFAIENDPGVKDSKMFLSDIVKDELSGMYSASFSSELTINNSTNQVTPIAQSAERRYNQTVNMEGQNQPSVQPQPTTVEAPKEIKESTQNAPTQSQPVINVNTTGADSELVRKLSEKIDALEKRNNELATKIESSQPQPKPEAKVEETNTIKTVMPSNDVEDLVNQIAEKLKPVITPTPITQDEFSGQGDGLTEEERTTERLAKNLERK